MEKYRIEQCLKEDVLKLLDIQQGSNYVYHMIYDMVMDEQVVYLKAVEEKKIAGYVSIRVVLDEAEVYHVGVLPGYRRQGIARGLVGEAIKRAVDMGARKVFLEVNEKNAGAMDLYKGLGFEPIAKRQKYYGEDSAIIMEYKLS